jgi:hypothetical protein
VARDPEELRHHDPDDLRAAGDLDAGELLHRETVGEVVHHAAQVIHPVGVGDIGVPGLALAHLLGAPVVIADVQDHVGDLLAVELKDEPDEAVGAGVLGPQVQEEEVGVRAAPRHAPLLGTELERVLFLLLLLLGQAKRTQLGRPGGMVLAERVSLPGRGHQDPAEPRVAVEPDAEEVPCLALVPVRGRPDIGYGGQGGGIAGERHLHPDVLVPVEREKVVNDREIALGLVLSMGPDTLVDRGKIVEHLVRAANAVLQEFQDAVDPVFGYPERRDIVAGGLDSEDVLAKGVLQIIDYRIILGHNKEQDADKRG